MSETFQRRREYVNEEFARIVSGTHMSNREKSKLLKKLWKIAKKDIN